MAQRSHIQKGYHLLLAVCRYVVSRIDKLTSYGFIILSLVVIFIFFLEKN